MGPSEHRERNAERTTERPLHICPECDSGLVYPVDWEAAARDRWSVSLRCPSCEWTGRGTFDQDLVDAFDAELDDGMEAVLCGLRELTRDNLSEEIDRFVGALRAGAILPMDF